MDWHPLDHDALALAQKLNRPLLVDVGATWCTWCSLMDRDSYTHSDIAAFINANFVAVKIDYDADPKLTADIERAAARENLPAGIPLTLFLTPQRTLFAGGSYYPPVKSADKIAFKQALDEALSQYRQQSAALERNGTKINF